MGFRGRERDRVEKMDRGTERGDYKMIYGFFLMNVMKMIMNMMKNTCLNYAPSWVSILLCNI